MIDSPAAAKNITTVLERFPGVLPRAVLIKIPSAAMWTKTYRDAMVVLGRVREVTVCSDSGVVTSEYAIIGGKGKCSTTHRVFETGEVGMMCGKAGTKRAFLYNAILMGTWQFHDLFPSLEALTLGAYTGKTISLPFLLTHLTFVDKHVPSFVAPATLTHLTLGSAAYPIERSDLGNLVASGRVVGLTHLSVTVRRVNSADGLLAMTGQSLKTLSVTVMTETRRPSVLLEWVQKHAKTWKEMKVMRLVGGGAISIGFAGWMSRQVPSLECLLAPAHVIGGTEMDYNLYEQEHGSLKLFSCGGSTRWNFEADGRKHDLVDWEVAVVEGDGFTIITY